MKRAQLMLLVSFVVLLDVSTSRSATLLSAAYSIAASASDPTVQPNQKQVVATGGDTFVPLHEVDGGELLFEGHALAERADTIASAHVTARASVGSIGLSITGGVTSASGGEAKFGVLDVHAGWSDVSIVRARGKANGQSLIFNTFLELDGEMNATVSGTDSLGRAAGSAFTFLQITDSSPSYSLPTAPYAGGYWARIIENPLGNQHVRDEVPGAIHLQFVMQVGQPFTLSFNMHLANTSSARVTDGVTALLDANFGNSLKWGGVESVTDLNGNLIPREDWSIESESGFDYSRSFDDQLPEPASGTLLGIALCVWLGRARKPRALYKKSATARSV